MIKTLLSVVFVVAMFVGLALSTQDQYDVPRSTKDFANTSVMLTVDKSRGGGSGVILSSNVNESLVLTNKHVCEILQTGGKVKTVNNGEFKIQQYKIFPKHDLCLVKVNANLGLSIKVATQAPSPYSDVIVSGHPALLPYILTKGHFRKDEYRHCCRV